VCEPQEERGGAKEGRGGESGGVVRRGGTEEEEQEEEGRKRRSKRRRSKKRRRRVRIEEHERASRGARGGGGARGGRARGGGAWSEPIQEHKRVGNSQHGITSACSQSSGRPLRKLEFRVPGSGFRVLGSGFNALLLESLPVGAVVEVAKVSATAQAPHIIHAAVEELVESDAQFPHLFIVF
jgi:hypothetical protein